MPAVRSAALGDAERAGAQALPGPARSGAGRRGVAADGASEADLEREVALRMHGLDFSHDVPQSRLEVRDVAELEHGTLMAFFGVELQ